MPGYQWPLVGRAAELHLVQDIIGRRSHAGVVIAGEAGVGKTRLAREGVALAERRGGRTAWVVATKSAQGIPFGAFSHLLPTVLPPASARENVIRSAAEALIEPNQDRGLVLGVDDAHLLDDHSAALLQHLAVTRAALLVISLRSGEPAPDSVVRLWKDGLCERIELQPLSQAEVADLAEQVLGAQVEGATQRRLWEQTRGSPLFLRELIVAGLASEALTAHDGLWRWRGPLAPSDRLVEVIEARLAGLTPEQRRVAEIAAVAEHVGIAMLESLVDRVVVAELERLVLLEEVADGRRLVARSSHPLYAETLRAAMPPARARAIANDLADALASTGARRRGDLLRLARWRLESGTAADLDILLPAAAQALALTDYVLAERLAQAAGEAGGGTEATVARAQALMGQGRFGEADALLMRVEMAAETEPERATAIMARAHNMAWNMLDEVRAIELLQQAEATISDAGIRQDIAALRAHFLWLAGRGPEAISAATLILDDPDAGDRAVFFAVAAAGQGLIYSARPTAAMEILEARREQVLRVMPEVPYAPIGITMYETVAAMFAGRLRDAERIAEAAYQHALTRDTDWVQAVLGGVLGSAVLAQGRVRTGARLLHEAAAILRHNDVLAQLGLVLAELAHARALLGDVQGAQATLEEWQRTQTIWIATPFASVARVWRHAAAGETTAAIDMALRGAEAAALIASDSLRAVLLHAVVRLGAATTVVEPLQRLEANSDSELIHTFAAHARALVDGDAPALEEVAHRFQQLPAFLLAAEASAQAVGLYHGQSRAVSAVANAERARALGEQCEGARTPALINLEVAPHGLTGREREVAQLAARGLASREIAEHLVVSVRTVENHLHAAYAKLGISRRGDLAAIFGVPGPGLDAGG